MDRPTNKQLKMLQKFNIGTGIPYIISKELVPWEFLSKIHLTQFYTSSMSQVKFVSKSI